MTELGVMVAENPKATSEELTAPQNAPRCPYCPRTFSHWSLAKRPVKFCAGTPIPRRRAAKSAGKDEPQVMVELTCSDCRFQIPAYARTAILRKPDIATDEFTCPTCGAVYRVSVQQTKPAALEPNRLALVRNRNR